MMVWDFHVILPQHDKKINEIPVSAVYYPFFGIQFPVCQYAGGLQKGLIK